MNTQARKLTLIEKLILLQDEKILDKIESFFSSFQNKGDSIKKPLSDYKKKILSVSVWTDADVALLENNLKKFNTWKIEKW